MTKELNREIMTKELNRDITAIASYGTFQHSSVNTKINFGTNSDFIPTKPIEKMVGGNMHYYMVIEKIKEYAQTNGESDQATIEDYSVIMQGVEEKYLSEINKAIALLEANDVNTALEIQTLVNRVQSDMEGKEYVTILRPDAPIGSGTLDTTLSLKVDDEKPLIETPGFLVGEPFTYTPEQPLLKFDDSDFIPTKPIEKMVGGNMHYYMVIEKIKEYAQTNGESDQATIEDYSVIMQGVEEKYLSEINKAIALLEANDVNTALEIQTLVNRVQSDMEGKEYVTILRPDAPIGSGTLDTTLSLKVDDEKPLIETPGFLVGEPFTYTPEQPLLKFDDSDFISYISACNTAIEMLNEDTNFDKLANSVSNSLELLNTQEKPIELSLDDILFDTQINELHFKDTSNDTINLGQKEIKYTEQISFNEDADTFNINYSKYDTPDTMSIDENGAVICS
jgi:antirestriction protein